MKILVTGAKGQLGCDVVEQLKQRGHEVIGVDVEEMDITNDVQVSQVMEEIRPEGVIHCAAYTAVDAAEDNVQLCQNINVHGTENIVKYCEKTGCKLIYLSTDYVFDGEGNRPWEPDDEADPLNVYGQTKYEGEQLIRQHLEKYYIVRISWVFGKNGRNFIQTMLRLGKENGAVKVVNDQIGSPTYTYDLARLLIDMVEKEEYGTYHATNLGICSWYQFACEIFHQAGMEEVIVTPVTSEEFPAKARRPHNSIMNKAKLEDHGFQQLPTWQDALRRYLQEMQ